MQKNRVVINGSMALTAALAMSSATDIPVAKETLDIKPKPLTEADICYDNNGKRLVTKVWQPERGSYLCNPANLVRRKLSGRQRKRMFKQSYKLKKIEKGIEEVNNASTNTTKHS